MMKSACGQVCFDAQATKKDNIFCYPFLLQKNYFFFLLISQAPAWLSSLIQAGIMPFLRKRNTIPAMQAINNKLLIIRSPKNQRFGNRSQHR